MLTLDGEGGSIAGLTSRQLAVQREVEGYLEKKAQGIVGQIVGAANARVQVSALVNFDRVERTVQAVDPDKQAVATEQKAEITPGAQGGAASSNTATSYETTHSTETFSGAIGNVTRLTVAVLVNDRVVPGPKPSTVPRDRAELARIDTLVRNAVGIDSARGDKLSVVNAAFDGALAPTPATDGPRDVWSRVGEAQRPIVTALALLVVLVVAVLALRALRPARAPELAASVPALPAAGQTADGALAAGSAAEQALGAGREPLAELGSGAVWEPSAHAAGAGVAIPVVADDEVAPVAVAAEPLLPPEPENPVRDQARAIIAQRPDAATRVVRAWLKQD
jgi:flagellar M-ring protein FliF